MDGEDGNSHDPTLRISGLWGKLTAAAKPLPQALSSGAQPGHDYIGAMPAILYTVRATCRDVPQRGRFLSWLSPNHVAEVLRGGATAVRIVLPDRADDTAPAVTETQYVFPSRKAFDTYIRDHAPALRADAMKHFPAESGIVFERQVSEIATEL